MFHGFFETGEETKGVACHDGVQAVRIIGVEAFEVVGIPLRHLRADGYCNIKG